VRIAVAMLLLVLIALPGLAGSDPPDTRPSNAATNRNEARWADREAEARIVEGDYDGAVQAKQQADSARAKAEQQELAARAPKHP
jgi:hypothetical protein